MGFSIVLFALLAGVSATCPTGTIPYCRYSASVACQRIERVCANYQTVCLGNFGVSKCLSTQSVCTRSEDLCVSAMDGCDTPVCVDAGSFELPTLNVTLAQKFVDSIRSLPNYQLEAPDVCSMWRDQFDVVVNSPHDLAVRFSQWVTSISNLLPIEDAQVLASSALSTLRNVVASETDAIQQLIVNVDVPSLDHWAALDRLTNALLQLAAEHRTMIIAATNPEAAAFLAALEAAKNAPMVLMSFANVSRLNVANISGLVVVAGPPTVRTGKVVFRTFDNDTSILQLSGCFPRSVAGSNITMWLCARARLELPGSAPSSPAEAALLLAKMQAAMSSEKFHVEAVETQSPDLAFTPAFATPVEGTFEVTPVGHNVDQVAGSGNKPLIVDVDVETESSANGSGTRIVIISLTVAGVVLLAAVGVFAAVVLRSRRRRAAEPSGYAPKVSDLEMVYSLPSKEQPLV